MPLTWKPTWRSATCSFFLNSSSCGVFGLAWKASRLCRLMVRQSPTATRNTSGRGRLSGRSATSPGTAAPPRLSGTSWRSTTSRCRANIMPLMFCAPRRLNISGWSRATTLATRLRWHCTAASASAAGQVAPSSASAPDRKRKAPGAKARREYVLRGGRFIVADLELRCRNAKVHPSSSNACAITKNAFASVTYTLNMKVSQHSPHGVPPDCGSLPPTSGESGSASGLTAGAAPDPPQGFSSSTRSRPQSPARLPKAA
ncbi:hypothetical protein D9M68_443530 [compost metagenome]